MHQPIADIQLKSGCFMVSGELSNTNVMAVYEKSLRYLAKCPVLEFDFSAVKSSDSAGIALMVEWLHYAKQQRKNIRFLHVSSHLLSLAKAAGLESLIVSA